MAGGGSLGGGHKPKRGKAGKRKQKKRIGFVLDMTPLVDITFLLLTFFMFTTTMAQPQVMQMSVPPEVEVDVPVAMSKLMSFYVDDDGTIYFFRGDETPEKIELKDVKKLATRETVAMQDPNSMITVLKIAGKAPYGLAVSILDELNLAEVSITQQVSRTFDESGKPKQRERRFTIANMEEIDFKKLEEAKGGTP